MSNSVNLSLDITKTGIQNPLIKVRQGDGGFETLHTTVTANGEPMDLQGWTITFMGTTSGDHKIIDDSVRVIEAPNGIFDYTPSKAWGMDIGEFKTAYFKFVKGDGSASSANFRVNVIEAVDLTQEEAQNYIAVVDTTIAEARTRLENSLANVTQSIADANDTANTISSNVATLGDRVDEYNNQLAAIKIGGRNYLLNSSGLNSSASIVPVLKGAVSDSMASVTYLSEGIKVSNDRGNKEWFYGVAKAWTPITNTPLVAGNTYTLSVMVKGDSPQVALRPGIRNAAGQTTEFVHYSAITNDPWTKVAYTFTIPSDTTSVFLRVQGANNNNYVSGFAGNEFFIMKELKLEAGNAPTDWTPAPDDAFGAVEGSHVVDELTAWETPNQTQITMTGPFSNSDQKGYVTYQGSLISFNFGGQIGSTAPIGYSDVVIGQLPPGVPLPIATIRGFVSNVSSSSSPAGAIRINTDGSITMNIGDAYTPSVATEYWEMSATGFTKAVFAPLSNSSYQNVVEFSPTSATQGAAFTKDYYFAMAVSSTDAKLVVYDRKLQTSKLVSFDNGPSNYGFVGHANDLAVLRDDTSTNGSIWLGASHLYQPGMPIISYNPTTGLVTKQGNVTFTTNADNPVSLVIYSIVSVDVDTSEIIVASYGKYWKGTLNKDAFATTQNITVTPIGADTLTITDYRSLLGSNLADRLPGGQADWKEGDKFYKVRTASQSTTLSVVMEFTMVDQVPKETGRYWLTNYPSWANNEIEKVWVEDGSLYVNVNKSTVAGTTNIIAKLGDL